MKVSEILRSKGAGVTTITPVTTIKSAAHMMKIEGIGALLVKDNEVVTGILSERDIVRALVDHGAATLDMSAHDLMTTNLYSCTSGQKLTDVMKLMTQKRIRHLPVIENNELLGIVSIGDAVKHRLEELELETNVLRDAYTAVS